ncbi:hypothetical protein [Actinomyces sp. ZJ308]|uniref:hypothetical protein n=1 Tax=Actinomyces sp. ZJ308 TaxID=2708342 RepID=UPI0014234A3A|nr:hypothetical protein [Actinomyces sp. ZJ308]
MRTRLLHRNHAGRSSHTTRCLALGLCLTAGLALSACGPAHKGQLTVEPVRASAGSSDDSSQTPSAKPSPSTSATPSASTTPSASAWTMPSVTITNERTDIWQQDDNILSLPLETSFLINRGYLFNDRTCQGILRYQSSQDTYSSRSTSGDDAASSSKVQEQSAKYPAYTVTSGPTVVDVMPDDSGTLAGYEVTYTGTITFASGNNEEVSGYRFFRQVGEQGATLDVILQCSPQGLPSLQTWHDILSGTRVSGLDAGAMA